MREVSSRIYAAVLRAKPSTSEEWRQYFDLLRRAAALGHVAAWAHLGEWYMEGFRTPDGRVLLPRRIRAGAALVAAAADEGHVPAFQRLALCYDCGEGVQRSEEAALYWYRRAFRGGDVSAAFNASTVYRDRGDRRGQRRWLRRGADLGDPDAVLELAKLTLDSKVTVAARTEALRGLAKLARQAGTPLGAEAHRLLHRYDSSKRRSGSKRP